MTPSTTIDFTQVAAELGLRPEQVASTVGLLDQGNTVPFITRYRKDQTGGLDEEQIRQIQSRVLRLRMLAERKQTILRTIDSQGKLTPELAALIAAADTVKRVEDLYLPFKPKKQTLATTARERGLELLADEIMAASVSAVDLDRRAADFVNPDRQVPTAAEALLGAGHILAEAFSERADLRQRLREILERSGKLVCAGSEADAEAAKPFRDYFTYGEQLSKVPPHRVLAINRGEKAKVLRVKVDVDVAAMEQATDEMLVPAEHPHADFLRGCGRDALQRLILPSLEREVRRELTDMAEIHAVNVFARNLRKLLLQAPVRDRRVLAIDPGFKSGSKLVALDEFGKVLDRGVVYLVGKEDRREQAKAKIAEIINQHQVTLVAIGNGTACRETESLVADLIAGDLAGKNVAFVVVNEAGASVYSTSPIGREEFPEFDATVRGAISIGRRLQDPLSELVKIDPANIGVGMYQHDVKARHLQSSLDEVVESCVNYVGVDVNSASPALLRYVSGLNQLTARRVYDFRAACGPFKSRDDLKQVPGLGEASFVQAAGFLKIVGGANPLDATWIHPESYAATERVLEKLGCTAADLAAKGDGAPLAERIAKLDFGTLSAELNVGQMLLKDILAQLARPGRDPREDLSPPLFKQGVLKLEDLAPGMELSGTVLNVVDFGAFVDIGLKDSGLVHVSQLARKFVHDPHEVISVGDIVKVWVLGIDKDRRRVSLTMVPPGETRPTPPRRSGKADVAAATPEGAQRTPPPPHARGRGGQRKKLPIGASGGGQTAGSQSTGGHSRGGHGGGGRSGGPPRTDAPPRKPKPPAPPISEGMRKGKEPLRTFGDLKQFFELKKEPPQEGAPPA